MDTDDRIISLESLPDIDVGVGVAGQTRHVEVGGDACFGIDIAIAVYAAHDGRT